MRVRDYSRVQVYLDPERHAELKALSVLLGRSASNLLNEAFDNYLDGLSSAQRQAIATVLEAKQTMGEGAR